MSKVYKIEKGGLHDRFQNSRAKIQLFGGGFGNGKTTAAVIKALKLAMEYPGSNGLIARATFPKLNTTIRKAFEEWCPPDWIKRNVNSRDNLIELMNGSVINFSYIAQGGKQQEASTSNLLSATFDWIVVDQIEDPEITEKDFLDLLGRLRGNTTYQGDDETMPTTGPRWLVAMCNPTRNWVYRKLVKPLQDHANGIPNPDLMADENGQPIVELFEGSTYDNADNLPTDFIKTQEAAYKGQMRKRFLLGEWGAYEGLIYPEYTAEAHTVTHSEMEDYYNDLIARGANIPIVEAYDHGIASPSCYGFAFADDNGNLFLLDGFHQKELSISKAASKIKTIRDRYGFHAFNDEEVTHWIYADPSIFRRASGNAKTVGVTTSGMFRENGIYMRRANNDILNGIAKVQMYLNIDPYHVDPFTEHRVAPHLYISKHLEWFDREIVDYYWKKDNSGEYEDTPNDRNDHAMDMLKYLLTDRPKIATINRPMPAVPARRMSWHDKLSQGSDMRQHRHG